MGLIDAARGFTLEELSVNEDHQHEGFQVLAVKPLEGVATYTFRVPRQELIRLLSDALDQVDQSPTREILARLKRIEQHLKIEDCS